MDSPVGTLELLGNEFRKCNKCRVDIPEIGGLSPDEFVFHWKPYYRGTPPLEYVLLTWEPATLDASMQTSVLLMR
jgi:hypothetical protein